MNYKYSNKESEIERLAVDALDAHLYVDGWLMQGELLYPSGILGISVAYDNGPIGCAVNINSLVDVMVFVKEEYRRRGIGKTLLKKLNVDNPRVCVNQSSYRRKVWESAFPQFRVAY